MTSLLLLNVCLPDAVESVFGSEMIPVPLPILPDTSSLLTSRWRIVGIVVEWKSRGFSTQLRQLNSSCNVQLGLDDVYHDCRL